MKKILLSLIILIFYYSSASTGEINCVSKLNLLKPECNFIGKSMKKIKNFSEKNKTLDQSYGNLKQGVEKIKNKIQKK